MNANRCVEAIQPHFVLSLDMISSQLVVLESSGRCVFVFETMKNFYACQAKKEICIKKG